MNERAAVIMQVAQPILWVGAYGFDTHPRGGRRAVMVLMVPGELCARCAKCTVVDLGDASVYDISAHAVMLDLDHADTCRGLTARLATALGAPAIAVTEGVRFARPKPRAVHVTGWHIDAGVNTNRWSRFLSVDTKYA